MNDSKQSRGMLAIILLTVFIDLVGFSIIFPLFPDMLEYYLAKEGSEGPFHNFIRQLETWSGMEGDEARFAATVLFGGLLGSLYSTLQFLTAPIWGALSDRHGRRKILMVTIAGTALSYLVWVGAGNLLLLIISRLAGGAMAGNLSVATAAVADVTDSSSRAKGMGMIGAAFGVGFIVGPALGSLFSLIDLQSTLAFVPGINPFSMPALIAFALAAVNWILVANRLPETRWMAAEVEEPAADHGPARPKRPLNPIALFKPHPFPGINLTNWLNFTFIAAFAGMEFTLTFLAKDRFNYSAAQNGYLFLFIGVVIVIVQGGLVRRLAPRFGEKRLVVGGLSMVLPGLILLGLCHTQIWLYFSLLLLAFGASLTTPSLAALASLFAPRNRQGELLGVFRSLGSLARAIAPLIAASVYWRYGSEWPYFGAAVILLLPLWMAVALPRPAHQQQKTS